MILQSNAFRFGNECYRQIPCTAMGTPMTLDYSNLFMDTFKQILLRDYCQKTGLSPLVRLGFIGDIPNKFRNMKSKIKFEIHLSNNEVHFLNVTVSIKNGKLRTAQFTKLTDYSLLNVYVNISFCHPSHVLKYTPKGQFIGLRHICPQKSDYLLNSKILCKKIVERSLHEKDFKKQ